MPKTKPPCFTPHSGLTPEVRCRLERAQARARCGQLDTEIERLKYLKIERRELLKALELPDAEFLAQLDTRRAERGAA